MTLQTPPPAVLLKKSPFLVVKQIDDTEVRVYSRMHGNLTAFDVDIQKVLKLFDTPANAENAAKIASQFCKNDASDLIRELYAKHFLVEANKDEKAIFSEYISAVRHKNRIPKVSKVTFLVSDECNLACKGCYHTFYDFKSTQMSSDFAGQILEGLFPYLKKNAVSSLVISFLGYEPFLNFEAMKRIYDQVCSMSDRYDIKTSFHIFTNAFSLDESMHAWIERNISKLAVKVSLDGIKEDNDKRRVDFAGKGTYERVVKNLRRILATGVKCSVLIVLSKLNFSNIEKFVDEMDVLGIRQITANMFCGQSRDERMMELTTSEKIEAIKRMDQAAEKHGIRFDGEWKYAVVQMITGAHFTCPAGIKQLVFSADGVIYPCQRFAGTPINFGTYTKDFWEKISEDRCEGYRRWTADLYRGLTERSKTENIDLAGWSCPFLLFIREECISKHLEREFNERLLEYYITRPLDRIIAESPRN
ncbi:radical SAM protein [Desulfococcus multivorans]|uniref:Radical SAM domain protein n=1 Tax=Desulfococcus multivorans DSM 2059 TaxID=1121405 RepID=S7T8G6_DESML|nr:radical SAM protein [Desulfococcus multivorans]AOY59231.1 radical SAM domain protein [Desulfococcus multivorans]AQV01453.1 radical SAM protein [Desulfococcus multivorans]EPR32750.1 Radical SAM domain protein [Desulfococcus multivorans DSM 2059]SKA26419.1 radical SAM additional 4Fe4S-binding SPASM domain-containing protein [Desulfococcus multivorans DSM 2059]